MFEKVYDLDELDELYGYWFYYATFSPDYMSE